MQTNREDVGDRYKEILLPKPQSSGWAGSASAAFREYFTTLAAARTQFRARLTESGFEYIASAHSVGSVTIERDDAEAQTADADTEDEQV